MSVLSDNIGALTKSVREYYHCRMSLSMERANAAAINSIFDREYPIEDMPTPLNLYCDVVDVLKSVGTESLICPSNITYVQVFQRYCGDNNYVYILEEE